MKNIIFTQIEKEELVTLITSSLKEFLPSLILKKEYSESEFLDIYEASKFLKLTPSTLRKKANKGLIDCYKRSGRWYFLKSELIEYINQGKQLTIDEIQNQY